MKFVFEQRAAESPLVESIWRTESEEAGTFMTVAGIQWQMVISRYEGKTYFTVRGPDSKASLSLSPKDAKFFGINFQLGTFMPHLPTSQLVDVSLDLPQASGDSVWFLGAAWELPTFENADTFIARMMRDGLLVHDPIVEATRHGRAQDVSLRSVQRRFVRATGLTYGTLYQIERAHEATSLLEQGVSILDTVERMGYADQPHLTRSLKRFVGRTPAEILRGYWSE